MPKTSANAEREMDGVEKAAILLIALGPEKSAQIFKHLKEEEIEQLESYMERVLRNVQNYENNQPERRFQNE